jgi:hypothetical protein
MVKVPNVTGAAISNTSGQKGEAVVPDAIKGLNWGAFLLNWIWGIGNRTWFGLAALLPVVGWIVPFFLLIKGNEWAWRNKRWDSVEHFRWVQRRWAQWGVGLLLAGLILGGIGYFAAYEAVKSSVPIAMALEIAGNDPRVQERLGTPMQVGRLLSGTINVEDAAGTAEMVFPVSGPNGEGTLFLSATKSAGQWSIDNLDLEMKGSGERIDLK